MVRISDILRRMGGEEDSPKRISTPEEEKGQNRKIFPSPQEPLPQRRETIPTSQLGMEASEATYRRLLEITTTIFERMREEGVSIEGEEVENAVQPILDQAQKGNTTLLYIATTRSTPEYYLYAHTVNVCIFASFLGVSLGYDQETLSCLAISALLHDLGMVRVMEIAQKKKRLSPEEYKKITEHTSFTVEFFKRFRNLPQRCIEIVQLVHERVNGQGHPEGLKGDLLSEESQCVALCDVYEALTHTRSYRDKFSPLEALKEVLRGKEFFNPRVLKYFIQQTTLYPMGSWVEVSTGEQGRVISTLSTAPSRPTVKIYFDNQKKKLPVPKILDLSKHAVLYVKRGLEQKEAREKEKDVS